MKQNYLFKTLFLLCAVVAANSLSAADKWVKTSPSDLKTGDVVVIVDQTSGTAMSNDNGTSKAPAATAVTLSDDLSEISGDVAENLQWEVTISDGSYQFNVADTEDYLYCTNTNNGVRVGSNSNNAFTITTGGENNGDYLLNTGTSRYIGVYTNNGTPQDWRCYTSINANIKNCVTAFYKLEAGDTPVDTRMESTVTLGEYETTGVVDGTISLPTATVTGPDEAIIENATISWTSSNENVATIGDGIINLLAAGTTTIKATFDGDDTYKGSSASFTVTVTAPAATYTTLKSLQEAVTSTSTEVTIQFNDVFVTAVKGNNAYLADADGYGVLVYQKDHGLEAGQMLNGTINANLVLYRGQTEVTNFSTEGLTITTTELTPTVKTIDAITAANQSTLVTLKGVTYSDGKLSDGTNEITYYDTFSVGASLEDGATYDITGIVILYNTTIEIAPRTADDIVKTSTDQPVDERLDVVMSFPEAAYEVTLGEDFTAPVLTITEGYDGTVAYISSDETVATVAADGAVTILAAGKTTITATAPETNNYKSASASYALTVNAGEEPVVSDADVVYDIADDSWTVSEGVLTNGTESFAGEGAANFKKNSGYFMMGKNGAYINFPIYKEEVEKIVVTGRNGASAATVMNVFVGEDAVSTETAGCVETNTYVINKDYRTVGTQYTLKVLSNHNAQITKIEIYYVNDTTGIQTVNHTNVADGAYFNLAGQRVAAPAKGLYIVNGKKVVLK